MTGTAGGLLDKPYQTYDGFLFPDLPAVLPGLQLHVLFLSQSKMQSGDQMVQLLINGQSFKMEGYPISVKKGSAEIWEFRSEAQSMPHPMHAHKFQFHVVERVNSPAQL